MNDDTRLESLAAMLEPLITEKGFELVEIKPRRAGAELFISAFIDKPGGGITLDECAMINGEIRAYLEKELFPEGKFTLDVASPGLDRPLRTQKDFLRVMGKNIRVFLKDYMSVSAGGRAKKEFAGALIEALVDAIKINTSEGVLSVPLSNIINAKQIVGD